MRLVRTILAAVPLLVAGLGTPRVGAQPRPPATIVGTVKAEGNQSPLVDAEVRVIGTALAGRATASGSYRVDSVPPGQHMVQVRRLGYAPLYFAVTLEPGERRDVDVELNRLPTRLSEVRVRERSGFGARDANRMRDFEWRRRATATSARFLTRDDLARRARGAGTLFDVLRTEWPLSACASIGVRRTDGAGALGAAGARRGCRVVVSMEGNAPMDAAAMVDYPLHLVEAVEIYRGGIGMPTEFQVGLARSADVVLVVWTGVDTDW